MSGEAMSAPVTGTRAEGKARAPRGDVRVYVGAFVLALVACGLLFYTGPITKELDVRFYWAAFACSLAAILVGLLSLFLRRK